MNLNSNQDAQSRIIKFIGDALSEDIGSGDITTNSVVDAEKKAHAIWVSKESGIIAGLDIAKQVFRYLDKSLIWEPNYKNGDSVKDGDVIVEFTGICRAILTAERTALNIVQRMSGIATKTSQFVKKLEDLPVKLLDTRKTVPGMRILDKMSVITGGGTNHRMGLHDMVMIKDNHILAAGSISEAVHRVRTLNPNVTVEIESTTLDEVDEALEAGADIIMLDNMSLSEMSTAVKKIGNLAKTEASGNINETDIRQVAETGVDFISVGALTNSVMAFDISQRIKNIF